MRGKPRYNAACAAALASAGQGEDAAEWDEAKRTQGRQQALDWLRADLTYWTDLIGKDPRARPSVQKTLQHWQRDPDLVAVRDKEPLARLPQKEQQSWQKLWADVQQTLTLAQQPPPKENPPPREKTSSKP
jgi:hypothetical protein